MAPIKRPSRRRSQSTARPLPLSTRVAVIIFTILVVAGPLAFGAVDRITQIALLTLFAVGMFARPAVMLPLSRWGNRLAVAFVAILLLKEFAPAVLFGPAHWRTSLIENFGIELLWTHHPEPARALDALLVLIGAALWFLWVRTLASDRVARPAIAWSLVASGAVVTGIAFTTRGLDPHAIYGLRFTPGWTGFGPFPNRNHTGDFLAMALVLGCACTAWSGVRKKWPGLIIGILLTSLILVGLLATQSRGGLLAAGFGLAVFVGLIFLKVRSRSAVAIVVASALVACALALLSGGEMLGRFQSKAIGQISNLTRVNIWHDAAQMWRDAPLFGHGIDTFPQIIGLYQTLRLEDQVILHPESSWLQWLTEFGAVPVGLAVIGLLTFLFLHGREAFEHERGFFLRIGALATFSVLLFHSFIDVPGHRWGTLAFALAALALACPLRLPEQHLPTGLRRAALVPLCIAAFWALPFFFDWPAWTPISATRLIARESAPGSVPIEELEKSVGYFPLDARLQQDLAIRQVRILGRAAPTVWQRHFGIAAALVPGSWSIVAAQARAVAPLAPGLAIGYWQQAIDRCDDHRYEVLGIAVRETSAFPMADAVWGRYVEANPDLLLAYAQVVPDEQARHYYAVWWQNRALTADLPPAELELFYSNATRWGQRSQFDAWMRDRVAWKERDYRRWATLLHQWGDDERAFRLLSKYLPEPEWPKNPPSTPRDMLEMKWRVAPKNVVNAQQLALVRWNEGETVQSDEIVLAVARQENSPPWFVIKAGYIFARQGRFGEGVEAILRPGRK